MMTGALCLCTIAGLLLTSYRGSDMKIVRHDTAAGTVSLDADGPAPCLKDGELLIKVEAAGVNRLDLLQVLGRYPPPPGDSEVLGVEVSGVVASLTATAEKESGLKTGDRVMALVGGGGYAEYCAAPYQTTMMVPTNLTSVQAAAIPEVFLTAFQALVFNAKMKDGETLLIHAGASGVGMAAIQLARKLFKNIKVIVTSSSAEKLSKCQGLGADVFINYKTDDFSEKVLTATHNKGADVILDFVGAPYWEKHVQCVATDGRIVLLGLLGGAVTEGPLNLAPLLKKRVSLVCSTLRSRSLQYKETLTTEFSKSCLALFAEGRLEANVDSSFHFEKVAAAHDRMRSNQNSGKIILTW